MAGHAAGGRARAFVSACVRIQGRARVRGTLNQAAFVARVERARVRALATTRSAKVYPELFCSGPPRERRARFFFVFLFFFLLLRLSFFRPPAGTGVHAFAGPRAHTAIFAPRPRNAGISARRTPSLAKNRAYRRGFMPAETKIRGTGSE